MAVTWRGIQPLLVLLLPRFLLLFLPKAIKCCCWHFLVGHMTITTFRSLAKHLLRKYVPEDPEASFPSFLPYTPEQQRLPLQTAFKVHTCRRHGRTPVYLAKVLPYVSSHTAQDAWGQDYKARGGTGWEQNPDLWLLVKCELLLPSSAVTGEISSWWDGIACTNFASQVTFFGELFTFIFPIAIQ